MPMTLPKRPLNSLRAGPWGRCRTISTSTVFRVLVERRHNALGKLVTVSEATVKLTIGGTSVINAGEGVGPVDALDDALRKDLGPLAPYIEDLRLVDYKVRILTGGTEAITRVLIESADGRGTRWVHAGGFAQYRRCLVPGIERFDCLQALEVVCAGSGLNLFDVLVGRRPQIVQALFQRGNDIFGAVDDDVEIQKRCAGKVALYDVLQQIDERIPNSR